MPTTDPRLVHDTLLAEGTKLVAYRDTKGFWTIGTGHKLEVGHDWTGYTITLETATGLLAIDLETATNQCQTMLPEWRFLDTPCRQNAVVEIVFNMGIGDWMRDYPKTRASIQAQSWQIASMNLLQSPLWIKQVGLKRVARLADYLGSGSYSLSASSSSALSPSGAAKSTATTGST